VLSSNLAVNHEVRVQELLLVVAHWLAWLAVVRAAGCLQHLLYWDEDERC